MFNHRHVASPTCSKLHTLHSWSFTRILQHLPTKIMTEISTQAFTPLPFSRKCKCATLSRDEKEVRWLPPRILPPSPEKTKTKCLSLSLPRAGGPRKTQDLLHLGGILCYKKNFQGVLQIVIWLVGQLNISLTDRSSDWNFFKFDQNCFDWK